MIKIICLLNAQILLSNKLLCKVRIDLAAPTLSERVPVKLCLIDLHIRD